ncbi:hypothetical protein CLOP_g14253 [Closterium sp. NIES-67]|nr:hypothetical protein CLOP_g14253 [Closterium sp. NIES-67]
MAGLYNPKVAHSITAAYATRAHTTTVVASFLLLALVRCTPPATALDPIPRQITSKLSVARRGRASARTFPPHPAQFLAARRAEKASAAAETTWVRESDGFDSVTGIATTNDAPSKSTAAAAAAAAIPRASAANKAALAAIFAAAQLPIPANKPNACAWPGVQCADNGAVEGLFLSGSPLSHPPTPRLCNRTAREPGGKAPAILAASIGQLTDLTILALTNLWLAGSVPRSLSWLTKLGSLDLSGNCFTGSLPIAFFRMPNISYVRAATNFFAGGLPQRPAAYAAMKGLRGFDLRDNRLSGPIPGALATLPNFEELILDRNRLSGIIPPALLKKQLSFLSVRENRLSGDLSGQQIMASGIDFTRNRLTGNLDTIEFDPWVSFIYVSENLFSGSFPEILCSEMSNVQVADFSHNRLTGVVPVNCFNSATQGLRQLWLDHNNFSGSLKPFTRLSESITFVDLGFNKFSGRIPQGLATLSSLTYLDLGANSLTGPIPRFCQGQQALTFLNLAFNALSGPPTPLSFPTCARSLAALYLSSNRLSGRIPATISSFKRLRWLLLDRNALTGAIPAGVSIMQQLKGLGVSYNRLSGPIPAAWPRTFGQVLLAGNRLSGAVPAALSKLKRASFKPGNPNLCETPLPACK